MKTKVVIMFRGSNIEAASFLAYNGGNGSVRIYDKDHYDRRLDLARQNKLDYIGSPEELGKLLSNPDGSDDDVQLDLDVYNRVFC